MSYSLILPTLNEKGHIIKLIQNIRFIFSEIQKEYEIILVDDNSTDGTIDLVKNVAKDYDNIKLFVRQGLKKNLANSINLGIQKSKYENIIWMDSDFQHPPDYIKLFHDYQKKYDLIVFSRFLKNSIRYFEIDKSKKELNENQSFFYNKLCNIFLYRDITDYTSGFVCVKRKVFENYKLKGNYGDYFVNFVVYCKLNNYSIIELPFRENARYSGSSKTSMKNPFNYIYLTIHYFVSLINNFFRKVLS
jgi:dolichol-phosphate mannosyltransferase